MTQDINVLALVKGNERYIFLFDDSHRTDALRTLGRFAANPELSFTWYDAAVLSQKIRQTAEAVEAGTDEEIEEPVMTLTPSNRFRLPLTPGQAES